MWTRKELKQQAKAALQRNYWRIVLVTLIFIVLGNTNVLGSHSSSAASAVSTVTVDETKHEEKSIIISDEEESLMGESAENITMGEVVGEDPSIMDMGMLAISELSRATDRVMDDMGRAEVIIVSIILIVVFLVITIVVLAVVILLFTFLFNPIIVGAQRFMLRSIDGRAEVKEVAYAFDHSYRNVVKVMFRTQLSVFLWSLLFIIPGFYKQYQYRMVEYIMAEHPDMYYKDAMRLSKDMMNGEKWKAFILDLSFILWKIASVLTCGIVYILFAGPYQYLTNAALYRRLCALRTEQSSGHVQSGKDD